MTATVRWFVRGVLGRIKLLIDRIYANRHPGTIERALIRLAAPAVRQMGPNDRWSLGPHARYWARAAELPAAPGPRSRSIFVFCAYRGQFTMDLSFALLLVWRGHRVTFGYLPRLRSPIKHPLADHRSAGNYLHAVLSPISRLTGGRLKIVDLTTFHDPDAPVDEDFVQRQCVSDAVMMTRRESLDQISEEHRQALSYYAEKGRNTQRTAWGYFSRRSGDFDLAIVPNGTTFDAANLCNVLRRLDIPFNTVEKFAFRNVRVMNHGDDFRSFRDLDLLWEQRETLGYTGSFRAFAASKAHELMEERRTASTKNWAWMLQGSPDQTTTSSLVEAGISPTKDFILVCTNVPYDAGYDKLMRLFPSMRAWLVETVRHLLANSDATVVVRCHPAEVAYWGGAEKSEDNLAAAGLPPGERLIVIPGERGTNTYGLMEHCKFGIVFSSTTGLEMAMMGRNVLLGSDVYYSGRGFTTEANDRADYFFKLDTLARGARRSLTSEQVTDARLFHFMLHFVMQWPYPWDKGGSLRDWPHVRLLTSPDIDRFLPTIDALAMPPDEFRQHFAEFLSVARCSHLPRPPQQTDEQLQGQDRAA